MVTQPIFRGDVIALKSFRPAPQDGRTAARRSKDIPAMRLLRDLWATSRHRTLLAGLLIVVGAAGQAGSLALAGAVLVDRSVTLFAVLAVALVASVLSDVWVGLVAAGLTADWA